MKKTIALAAAAAICTTAPLFAQERRDPRAVELAHDVMRSMGGERAWNDVRYIRFDFKVGSNGQWRVDRSHLWDKWEGRYRLEQTTEDGKTEAILFNTKTREGDVYLDGEKVAGEAAADALERAYGAYINDAYWLAMPWKWLDPGVHLAYVGEKEHNGQACDVVELSFDQVGLTPGDRYQAYVSKNSKMMIYWEYTLESGRTGAWEWEYTATGEVALAKTHRNAEGMEINMGPVSASASVDETPFSDPAASIRR